MKPPGYVADDLVQDAAPQHLPDIISPPAASSSATKVATQAAMMKVPILMYHYIEHVKDPGDTIRQKLDVYPETLGLAIKTLQDDGYTLLFASELADIIDGKMPLPAKPILLTFDDGYRDFYTDALPVLEKYHAKATAYIITGFLGKPNYMTLTQLQTVQQSGIVEIGAHTEHHIDLNHASVQKQTQEITGSLDYLNTLCPGQIHSFAYPSGRFDQDTVKIVQTAGFSTGMSTNPGTEVTAANRYTLFRLRPGSSTGKGLLNFITRMEK
jgi:peptidoglycan/xylan/chitin deacetylase (PgdA/CDA1 family)